MDKITYPGLNSLSINWQEGIAQLLLPTPKLNISNFNIPSFNNTKNWNLKASKLILDTNLLWDLTKKNLKESFDNPTLQLPKLKTNQIAAIGTGVITNILSNKFSNLLFDDSELGRGLGTLFSSGVTAAGNTISDNLLKGSILTQGLSQNVANATAGAGVGFASNLIGQGISSLGGNSMLSKGIGAGISTGLGTVGGQITSNLINGSKGIFGGSGLFNSVSGAVNPYALGTQVLGSALGAAMGPSKEYGGTYGSITRTMDTIYDGVTAAANFIPVVGQGISGAMALNKGLSNIFGSTDGMTRTDAILGSAFMPAPVKWLNMWGSSKTGTFGNQSWQNSEKAESFIGNAFGNLNDRFNLARKEAGKTYGTFSQGAKDEAQRNIDFANYAWGKIMNMSDLNTYLNIRSLLMSSINNLRYSQNIQGGFSRLAVGKQGMKIFNNATNHNIGMRLLSGAALIDNKQMILSALNGTKIPKSQTAWQPILSDNTRVQKPLVVEPIERKLKPGLLFFNNHGQIVVVEPRLEYFSLDNRTNLQKEESHLKSVQVRKQELVKKAEEQTAQVAEALLERTTPSYWLKQVTREDPGVIGSLAVDLASPFVLGKGILLLGKLGQGINKLARLGVSPYTGRWTQFGNREFRLRPGYLGMNGTPIESRLASTAYRPTPKITPENAASITPEQWTAAQDAAIARGDMDEALRLRDLHFVASYGEKPIVTYRGQMLPAGFRARGLYKNAQKAYNDERTQYINGSGLFHAKRKYTAETYLPGFLANSPLFNDEFGILKLYSNFKNPFIKNFNGSPWNKVDGMTTNKLGKLKFAEGHDGIIYKNIYDSGGYNPKKLSRDELIDDVYNSTPGRSKLADAVTYKESRDPIFPSKIKKTRIPLGMRDDPTMHDLRYSWMPWFLEGSTAATLYNQTK